MQRTDQCKPRIEIHVSRFLERCIYADSDNPYQFKGSDSCVLAQMYLPLSNSGQKIKPIPEETVRVAQAAIPKGNPYLTLRDQLGTMFQDDDFADLYSDQGQPALTPWRLALVTIMQFRENLANRQAAEALRARIDWKYLLGLDLTDPGFDFSVLSEFRDPLIAGNAEALLLDKLLACCRTQGLLKARR